MNPGNGRRRHNGLSARARIIGWMLLLVTLALAASVLVTGRVLLARADAVLADELAHEGQKFRVFAARAVDPGTGGSPARVDVLLASFLRENVPDEHETFFSVIDGKASHRSPQPPPARLDLDPSVITLATDTTTPAFHTVTTAAGPALLAVYPVRVAGDGRQGALVVVEFAAQARAQAWSVVRVLAVVSFCALAAAGLISWLIAGQVLTPIRLVRQTAERIGESDLGRRIEVTGNDDVARLASTFNRMLDRIESAFAGQRRFLDDAGHELRTPLTVVRGHLELMGEDPQEQTQTLALVLDELDRMNRIVDDLTVLAKAGRPDFLRIGEVDLTELTIEVTAKSRALGSRHWSIDQIVETTVRADGQRLTQALMQLAANAVDATVEGADIAIGSAVHEGRMLLWVRDSGTGIRPQDRDRIFRRFERGHARTDRQGAGIGLSIVSSIATAHGGRVLLESTIGTGSTFTLELPMEIAT